MKNFKLITIVIFIISLISFCSIIYITTDLITDEKYRLFKIDFKNKSDIINSFGTLVSGLLSFLSILFVIYALMSQKNDQISKENKTLVSEKENLLENFKVFLYYLKSLVNTLEELNVNLKIYTENEIKNPTINNALLISINKNFIRIVDMDVKSTFMSFQNIYNYESKEKDFVKLYKMIDFYSVLYFGIQEDYEKTKNFRYDKLVEFGFETLELYNKKTDMIDDYKLEFPNIYKIKPWVEIASKSIGDYYKYIEDCEKKMKQHDFDYISDKVFTPFINSALDLRNSIGYFNHGEQEVLRMTSTLRKKLFYIKTRVINNAETLENTRVEYLQNDSVHLIELKSLIQKLEHAITIYKVS